MNIELKAEFNPVVLVPYWRSFIDSCFKRTFEFKLAIIRYFFTFLQEYL